MLSLDAAEDNRQARKPYEGLDFQAVKEGDSRIVKVLPLGG